MSDHETTLRHLAEVLERQNYAGYRVAACLAGADALRDDAEPEGRKWLNETWKCAFMHHLGWQMKFAMSLEGNDPFPIGYRSSQLTVAQMSDLIECVYEYGARHHVKWRETKRSGFMSPSEDAA